jgi:Ca-activated chloride channel family protein
MTFVHPWVLALLLLPLIWVALEWRTRNRRTALVLKGIATLAAIAALAEPLLTFQQSKVALAVAVDTSASVTDQDLRSASAMLDGAESKRGRNTLQVIPFARGTRGATVAEKNQGKWHLQHTAGDSGKATNLETAIDEAIAALPANAVRRVALVSDGHENVGSVTRAIWQARQLGIPVDAIPLNGQAQPTLRIALVSIPQQVFSGERFPVDLDVIAPAAASARVELFAEGRDIGSTPVNLQSGSNHLRVRASLNAAGAIGLSGRVSPAKGSGVRFEQAVNVHQPRVLLFSADPPESETHFTNLLRAGHFEVSRPAALPADLNAYQLIVYNNWDLEKVSAADQARLERFEQQGGGLLWIAGERNVYVDHKDEPETPLARALPAKLAPPRTPEGTAVVLIIDKSSSMEGKKIELARQAAIGVVDHLRPIDQVAVLIFDNSFQWAVSMRKVDDRPLIKKLISGIAPDGGTQIAPALAEAFRKVQPVNAVFKHIVCFRARRLKIM